MVFKLGVIKNYWLTTYVVASWYNKDNRVKEVEIISPNLICYMMYDLCYEKTSSTSLNFNDLTTTYF